MQSRNKRIVILALSALLVLGILVSMLLGRYSIAPGELFHILVHRILGLGPASKALSENIVFEVRLPRVLAAILVGAALSVSGASYQCIFHNPMAAPDVLGASTGAGFGAALAILLGLGRASVMLFAFIAGLACVLLALLCARLSRGDRVLSLVLAGIMLGSLFQAGTSYLKLIADPVNSLPEITYWLMGSLSGVDKQDLLFLLLPLLLGLMPIYLLRWRMNLLTLEDTEARTIGVDPLAVRVTVILASTLLTASAVSVSGIIGWVGLVLPHLARRLVGNDCRVLIPVSTLLGGVFLLAVDDLARTLYTTELPLGILTAVIGAPFFLVLLVREGRKS